MNQSDNRQIGQYELLRTLGSGGSSKVYLGRHRFLETEAAVKVLHASTIHEQAEQFEIEARLIASLKHTHIVRILDFDVENNIPFLVMEYAPHGSLRQLHPVGMAVPLVTVITHVQQVAGALQYAHDRGIIHRDVKPENMLVGERGEVLLADFGIAIGNQGLVMRATHNVEGTLPYIAPEQIDGRPCEASDQYSLAVVVYEWLSGTLPFTGTEEEIIRQHVEVAPPSLCARVPGVPEAVERVVMKTLSKDPEQRYTSVVKFASALEKASRQSSTSSSSRIGSNAPPHSHKRLSPFAISLLLMILLVICGGIWGIVTSITQQATVTITPETRSFTNDYEIVAVSGTSDSSYGQISSRQLFSTTPPDTAIVKATGMGETSAIPAKGILTFYNGLVSPQVIDAGTVIVNDQGIRIETSTTAFIPPANPPYLGYVNVPAHALQPGSSGNIRAGSINLPCCVRDDSVTVRNIFAFSGGQNAEPYIFVRQSDITEAADSLEKSLTPMAKGLLQKQLQKNEILTPSFQCIQKTDSDYPANARVTKVRVTVVLSCSGWSFPGNVARTIASAFLIKDAMKRLGTNYASTGAVTTSFQHIALKDVKRGIIFLFIKAEGFWVYQFSNNRKRLLAVLIVGKSHEKARTLLLMQAGVSQVNIQTSWWVPWIIRDRLPDNVNHITLNIIRMKPPVAQI